MLRSEEERVTIVEFGTDYGVELKHGDLLIGDQIYIVDQGPTEELGHGPNRMICGLPVLSQN